MIKTIFFTVAILFFLGFTNSVAAQSKQVSATISKADVKFLDDISVALPASQTSSEPSLKNLKSEIIVSKNTADLKNDIEAANKLQFKYSLLLDTEVEMVQNTNLFKVIDEWFGTRYRLGGTSKNGIDCSALMQVFFTALYGVALPRTAKEQYHFSRRISRTELKEGDLIFFNTTGGVSHVGMYLQNNKFVHAASGGVTISDIFDEYWMRRFIGVGRVEEVQQNITLVSRP